MILVVLIIAVALGLIASRRLSLHLQYRWRRHWSHPPAIHPEVWNGRRWAGPGARR